MKRYVLLLAILILGLGLKFSGLAVKNWREDDLKKVRDAEAAWVKQVENMKFLPGKLANADAAIDQGKWQKASELLDEFGKIAPGGLAPLVLHRKAEIQYRICESRLKKFIFFAENNMEELAGQERDGASAVCDNSEKMLDQAIALGSSQAEFFANYGQGNTLVRKAILAVSSDSQSDILVKAVRSYIAALKAKDDYETKINLELLLQQQEKLQSRGKDKKALSPEDFDLKPDDKGSGAGYAGSSKSKL